MRAIWPDAFTLTRAPLELIALHAERKIYQGYLLMARGLGACPETGRNRTKMTLSTWVPEPFSFLWN